MAEEVKYPTTPDADGWYIESSVEDVMQIFTKDDAEGNTFKKIELKGKRTAILRELSQKEFREASKWAESRKDDTNGFMASLIASCTLVDGKEILMEDILDKYKAKDVNKLTIAAKALNF